MSEKVKWAVIVLSACLFGCTRHYWAIKKDVQLDGNWQTTKIVICEDQGLGNCYEIHHSSREVR